MDKTLTTLAREFGTPCFFLSLEEIKNNFNDLSSALPGVSFYYAVKANPHVEVIDTLKNIGCFFDVSTNTEVDIIKNNKVSPDDCIHTHPIKSTDEIEHALNNGITIFTIDNINELEKLKPYKDKIELCVRLSIYNKDCRINLSEKFGIATDEAAELIMKAHQQGFQITTLSFHTGSQNLNPLKYVDALKHCQEIEATVSSHGVTISCIDIGGGFPVQYCGDPINIQKFCAPIKDYLEEHFQDKKILAEPGRFLVASAMSLVTKVKGKSIRQGKPWYFIDDSIYHSFSGITFDHCDFPMIHNGQGPEVDSTIAGATCDSCDVIKRDILLPELEVEDHLIFKQMGAYCSASASFFNGYPPTQIQVIK